MTKSSIHILLPHNATTSTAQRSSATVKRIMPRTGQVLAGLLVAAVAPSCSSNGMEGVEEDAPVTSQGQALTGEFCDNGGLNAVGLVDLPDVTCTGVRIGCGAVLTAAHCVNSKHDIPLSNAMFTDQNGHKIDLHYAHVIDHAWWYSSIYIDADQIVGWRTRDLAVLVGGERLHGESCDTRAMAKLPDSTGSVSLSTLTAAGTGHWWNGEECLTDEQCRFLVSNSNHSSHGSVVQVHTPNVAAGDSGGPLFLGTVGDDEPTVIGVLSGGRGACEAPDTPPTSYGNAYYTSVVWPGGVLPQNTKPAGAPLDFIHEALAQEDPDGDLRYNATDNCPNDPNPDQTDSDDDGEGDACEICPIGQDADNDKICDDVDNCLGVASADVTNSNLLAEQVHTPGKLWGDSCDPVPVPASTVVTKTVATANVGCSGSGHLCTMYRRTLSDELAIAPLKSRSAPGSEGSIAQDVNGVPTDFRFCQKARPNTPDPRCLTPDAIDDFRLTDPEEAKSPYHRVSMDHLVGGDWVSEQRGAAHSLDYTAASANDPKHQARWRFRDDHAYWSHPHNAGHAGLCAAFSHAIPLRPWWRDLEPRRHALASREYGRGRHQGCGNRFCMERTYPTTTNPSSPKRLAPRWQPISSRRQRSRSGSGPWIPVGPLRPGRRSSVWEHQLSTQ